MFPRDVGERHHQRKLITLLAVSRETLPLRVFALATYYSPFALADNTCLPMLLSLMFLLESCKPLL